MTAQGYFPLVLWLHMFNKVHGTYLNLVGHGIKAIYEVLVSVASLTWQDMLLRASSLYPVRCSQGRRVLCIFSGPKVKVLQFLLHTYSNQSHSTLVSFFLWQCCCIVMTLQVPVVIIPSHFVYDLVSLFVPFFPLLVLVTAALVNLFQSKWCKPYCVYVQSYIDE